MPRQNLIEGGKGMERNNKVILLGIITTIVGFILFFLTPFFSFYFYSSFGYVLYILVIIDILGLLVIMPIGFIIIIFGIYLKNKEKGKGMERVALVLG